MAGGVIRRRTNSTAQHATIAFERAITHNGEVPYNFHLFVREKCKRVVTDNGAEL